MSCIIIPGERRHSGLLLSTDNDLRISGADVAPSYYPYTVALWVYVPTAVGATSSLFSFGTSDSGYVALRLLTANGINAEFGNPPVGGYPAPAGPNYPVGSWFHAALAWNGTECQTFVNGVGGTPVSMSIVTNGTFDNLAFGAMRRDGGSDSGTWKCNNVAIHSAQIFNDKLNAGAIANLANGRNPSAVGPLWHAWNFSSLSGRVSNRGLRLPLGTPSIWGGPVNTRAFAPSLRVVVFGAAAGGATNTTITPAVGALTLTGVAPTVARTTNAACTPTVGALTLTGLQPTATTTTGAARTPTVGALTLTGVQPTVARTTNAARTPTVGALAFTGTQAGVSTSSSPSRMPTAGAAVITGVAPTLAVTANRAITVSVGALTFAGIAPTVGISGPVAKTPTVGSLSFTGAAPTVANIPPGIWTDVGVSAATWSDVGGASSIWTDL
jgi:hypothetical protein